MHTVEKIGGTSMSRFGEVMKNVIIGRRQGRQLYNRIFVVSAYGGVTNMLLENKKTGEPGIYGLFARDDHRCLDALEATRARMLELNRDFESIGLKVKVADDFVNERMDGIKVCLQDLMRLRTFGHFSHADYLPATREFLSAVGEAHSAYNSVQILKAAGVNAVFVDLTGWKETDELDFEQRVKQGFAGIDFNCCLPVVTGYAKCREGIMKRFDRGYSEITFSKIAVGTGATEGIIHKEYHQWTGDPKLIGVDHVKIIGNTNFDIADQLSDMDMEAIHSKASKEMEMKHIPIRIKNCFEPEHPGTLISHDYISPTPRVEMICGRNDLIAVEVHDPEMVGEPGYDYKLLKSLADYDINYIAKNTNANTITHLVPGKAKGLDKCIIDLRRRFAGARISTQKVGIVSVIGSNMKIPGVLAKAAQALADAGINILALVQSMRQVNIQFVVERENFNGAQIALHRALVEKV
ncbi:MAG: aspartate kinase [Victivallales bacterium]|nr:aspartate kinase [Victivallales bacterium]